MIGEPGSWEAQLVPIRDLLLLVLAEALFL
jgi:hypothetical protein